MLNKLVSKARRLAEMNSEEILFRLREKARIEVDRMRFQLGVGVDRDHEFRRILDAHRSSIKSYLAGGPTRRFYGTASAARRESILGFLLHRCSDWIDRAADDGDRLCAHRLNVLGYSNVYLGSTINWHLDPVTQYVWPQRFWAGYDLLNAGGIDPKIIHELNRQQHVARLAKAFFLTGSERYAREAVVQMETWIDQNPPGSGVNWQSSLDIAIRCMSWIWAILLLVPSTSFDEQAARRILKSLFRQLDHVYRYPSTHSSPNTHLIGEATALFIAGLVFPELRRAAQWRQFGSTTLVNEMQKQVTADGVYREASTYYHCYATDFYLQAMTLARINKVPFPEWMWNRLAQMLEFVLYATRPDGTIPLIGDDDGGRALALFQEHYGSYRDGLCAGAVLFGRSDFRQAAGAFTEETMWLLGEEAYDVFESLEPRAPASLQRSFSEPGYFVQRSDWSSEASHLIFNSGGLGMLSGGHGHAGALSFTLFGGGTELLIDPGTSVYNGAPQWRNFFRSTRAHNTVVIDGADQSDPGGTFSWKRKAETRLIAQHTVADMDYVDGEHEGYLRLRHGITHRRRVLFVRPNYWIVLDELRGAGHHNFDFLYHFAPGTELFILGEERRGHVDCRARLGGAMLQMFMYASGNVQAQALCGQTDPVQGWSSRRYGERKASPVLSASLQSSAPASMMTFLAPNGRTPHSHRLPVKGANAIAASLGDNETEDICVFVPEGSEAGLGSYRMCGELFWIRQQAGVLKQIIAINAKSLSLDGEAIFENDEPLSYVLVHAWDNGMLIERGGHEGKVYVRDLRHRQSKLG